MQDNLIRTQQSNAVAVKAVISMPGWSVIEEDLITYRDKLVLKLIESETEAERVRLQGEIRGINKLFSSLEAYKSIDTSKS